eukprot:1048623-Pyramimonas_sp.AAC.1
MSWRAGAPPFCSSDWQARRRRGRTRRRRHPTSGPEGRPADREALPQAAMHHHSSNASDHMRP